MEIRIANICGLCAGAKRAVDSVKDSIKTHPNVVMYKEILHNKNTVASLLNLGATQKDELSSINENDYVIVRAHGEPLSTYNYFNNHSIDYLDMTCNNVVKIRDIVKDYSEIGYKIIIIGKYGANGGKLHPEVEGVAGWSKTEPIFIEEEEDLKKIENCHENKYFAVCQTTFSSKKAQYFFDKIGEILSSRKCEYLYKNTICSAQELIKQESKKVASWADVMIVVGGKNSSNSKELAHCMEEYTKTFFIEDIKDLDVVLDKISKIENVKVGITAGASTEKEELFELKKNIEKGVLS